MIIRHPDAPATIRLGQDDNLYHAADAFGDAWCDVHHRLFDAEPYSLELTVENMCASCFDALDEEGYVIAS